MDAISNAATGFTTASNQFAASAARLASDTGDIASELTAEISDKIAFEASAAVLKSTAETQKRLLDVLV